MAGQVSSFLPSTATRRIAALVLPDLLCEIAEGLSLKPAPVCQDSNNRSAAKRESKTNLAGVSRGALGKRVNSSSRRRRQPPLAVLLDIERTEANQASEELVAVNETARQYGVRPGQTVTEACALLSHLVIAKVTEAELEQCLGRIAEIALGFGTTVSIEVPDTVWIDITGAAHLTGGELNLAGELASKVRAMGHVVRVAISTGPRLSQAFARWKSPFAGQDTLWVVPADEVREHLAPLPLVALPLAKEQAAWFVRLGVLTVGELSELPRAAAASRLGEQAAMVLELVAGRDSAPLVAFEPPRTPCETMTWEDPADGVEPLLFALRGLVSRLSARLEGRGEAALTLNLVIHHDRSIAALRRTEPITTLRFELAAPLWRSNELWRVVGSKLQRTRLRAPTLGLELEVTAVTRALRLQLDLSRGAVGIGSDRSQGPEVLSVLLAEVAADIGWERLGTLVLDNTHKPEAKSRLKPIESVSPPSAKRGSRGRQRVSRMTSGFADFEVSSAPTRLLPCAQRIDAALRPGATLTVGRRLYSIEQVDFERRLDCVEWWNPKPISRDYLRLWLQGGQSGLEVLVYIDRETGGRFLQAVCD